MLLIECDLIFEPAVIRRLLEASHPNVALVDRYRSGMDGTVVEVENGRITEVIVPQRQGAGFVFDDKFKTLHIYRFSREFCAGSFKKLLEYYSAVISDNDYYEMVLGIIIYLQSEVIHAELIDGERWAEIDDPNDIQVARYLFDPASRRQTLEESFGGYWNYDVLDFSFLRNMCFPTGAVFSELRNTLPALIENYGSAQALADRKLADYLCCRPERVVVLNGASQVYPVLRDLFSSKRVLLPAPTFGEYRRIFPDAEVYHDRPGVGMDEIVELAEDRDLVVFVNPNNPTGTVLSTRDIYEYAAAHPGKTVVCDESFLEFSDEPSLLGILEESPLLNLILVKSLGKTLGVPGMRLGYVYSKHAGFLERLRASLPIWNLNSVAEHFLELILKHRPDIEASLRQTVRDREELRQELAAVPTVEKVWPSGGNFLLVTLRCSRASAKALAGKLLTQEGMLVKDVSERFVGEGAWWRLAVRTPDENRRLVAALMKLCGPNQQDRSRIWANKKLDASEPVTLSHLLSLSGYDNFGGFTEQAWLSRVSRQMEELEVQPADSIFEVGCGAGAFLYPWRQRGHLVAGIDYSANLVAAAKAAMPVGDFQVGDASALDPREQCDIVVSRGVFLYFPDLEYAAAILRKMLRKARKTVSVLELPNLAKQDEALAARREKLGDEEYRRQYDGLEHLYFRKDWFEEILTGPGVQVSVEDEDIPGYFHAKYRFQVVIRKSG